MSGGVDSSVAAARVAARGLRAVGITLAMWPRDREAVRDRGCCSVDAVEDARRVAASLGVPHYVWNLEAEFDATVVRDFADAYARGRTPNPCTRCNERVKFGELMQRAAAVGATHLVTGHYARVGRRGRAFTLHRAAEPRRDQSYVLHRLDQAQLSRAVFPLGGSPTKEGVRAEAADFGLVTAAKPESQDLCFVDGSLRDDLRRRLRGRFRPGPIIDERGQAVGRHEGLPFFTVGQRSGLGLAPSRADAPPLYVLALRPADNAVVVGPRERLACSWIEASMCRWVSGSPPPVGERCTAQLRSHGQGHEAVVERASGGLRLRLPEPAAQVSPGQAVVLYRDDEALGGGIIDRAG